MRSFRFTGLLWLFCLVLLSCAPVNTPEAALEFSGERAYQLAAEQVNLGPRHPGSPGHQAVQSWMIDQLETLDWRVEGQSFTYKETELLNVVARNNYQGKPFYILGAHYDTRPVADEEPDPNPGPVLGANDGASGVAVLLELARVLDQGSLDCQLWLVFFDAEDSGGLDGWNWIVGSTYFAENLSQRPTGVVIADLVGDRDLNLPRERNSSDDLQEEIWELGQSLGYSAFEDTPGYSILDDHTPFLQKGIPAVDIIDFDYAYWHTEEDTMDKISPDSLEAVGVTLQVWLETKCNALSGEAE